MAKGIKTGGRKKGVPNKTTNEMRELITVFISDNWDQVQEDFNKLEPSERLRFFEKIMQYAVPKMQSQSINLKEDKMEKPFQLTIETTSDNE